MCGFVVVYHPDGKRLPARRLEEMCAQMTHRGPNHFGTYQDQWISLGHRRLSIIDLSSNANQPMIKDDLVLVHNGEIYNYVELREELESEYGSYFETQSDSEVILEAYSRWGVECLEKFNGMFAFSIWDRSQQTLFIARDRLGVKPLFAAQMGSSRLFASDIKALWEVISPSGRLNACAIYNYFTQSFISEVETSTRGIEKVPPGTYSLLTPNGEESKVYWDLNRVRKIEGISFSEAVERTESLLRDAVRLRLRSDVPLGCFLSGGVDSSLVSALAATEREDPIHTYSIGFDAADYDESKYAEKVVTQYGTIHHHRRLDSRCLELLPRIVWNYSELFGDSSALPTYLVSEEASTELTVVLTGDGADEAFGGYVDPFAVYLNEFYKSVPSPIRKVMAAATTSARRLHSHYSLRWLNRFNDISFMDLEAIYSSFKKGGWGEIPGAFHCNGKVASQVNLDYLRKCASDDPVDKFNYADITERLSCDFLVKVDMASMAHSLEARSPFLDFRLIEWGYSLENSLHYRRLRRKSVLKAVAEKYIDHDVIHRKKMGFSIPLARWLQEDQWFPVVAAIIRRPSVLQEFIQATAIEQVLSEFESGQHTHANRIWLLLWFQLWEGLFVSGIYQPQQALSEVGQAAT
jgi:asparagine synthase (glutamine-hydrolysing)